MTTLTLPLRHYSGNNNPEEDKFHISNEIMMIGRNECKLRLRVKELGQPALKQFHGEYDMFDPDAHIIGEGATSTVWSARCRRSHEMVAVKIIANERLATHESEISTLHAIQDVSYVVRLLDHYKDDCHTILIMELCQGFDLQTWDCGCLQPLMPYCVYNTLQCLFEMHHKGIYHGDVRLENVIVNYCPDTGKISTKLVDFGSSHVLHEFAYMDLVGVARMVIEVLAGTRLDEQCEIQIRSEEISSLAEHPRGFVLLLLSANQINHMDILQSALLHPWCTALE
jgi:serine/threonine protein kinase